MSSVDLRALPDPAPLAVPAVARRKDWQTALLRVLGGFALTGVFLVLAAAVFGIAGVYGLIEFARLY
jgi:hypothetical protein